MHNNCQLLHLHSSGMVQGEYNRTGPLSCPNCFSILITCSLCISLRLWNALDWKTRKKGIPSELTVPVIDSLHSEKSMALLPVNKEKDWRLGNISSNYLCPHQRATHRPASPPLLVRFLSAPHILHSINVNAISFIFLSLMTFFFYL